MNHTAIAAVAATAGATYYYRKNAVGSWPRYEDDEAKSFPFSFPLIAHLWWTLNLHLLDDTVIGENKKATSNDPLFMSIPFFPNRLIISDPQSLQHILSNNFDNYHKGTVFTPYLTEAFGHGIFNSDGETWYWQRKLASKVFTTKSFKTNFETVFHDNISLFIDTLNDRAKTGNLLDLHDMFYRFFMDSFGKIAFGVEFGAMSFKDLAFVGAFDRSQRVISKMMVNPFIWLVNQLPGQYKRDVKMIRSFGINLIRERRAKKNSHSSDLLSLFMAFKHDNGEPLSEEELVDQVINFIIAGRDTTAQALSWTFYDLASRPDVVKKIVEEFKAVVGDSVLIPAYEQVKELKYAKAVFLESLRLHPSVRRDGKEAMGDDVLPCGQKVKKGTHMIWMNYSMGRSERIWKNAEEYKPERWLGTELPTQFEYPVFNCGPRICLGKTLAELQGVFALVCIVRQFKVEPIDISGVDFLYSLTNPMKDGLLSKIKRRL